MNQRRLAAILSLDVVGFSRMMQGRHQAPAENIEHLVPRFGNADR